MPMSATPLVPLIRRVSWQMLFLRTLIVGAGTCLASLASANDAATAAAAEPSAAAGLEEIVVTATRREENISKVPISVTAFSQDMIDQRGVKDFQDVVRFTPGVSIDNSGTNAISIRGISSSGGAGTTGIYIDDSPIQMRALGFNPDDTLPKTFDLDRVEVLRGRHGALHHDSAQRHQGIDLRAQRSVHHPRRRAQLRSRHRTWRPHHRRRA